MSPCTGIYYSIKAATDNPKPGKADGQYAHVPHLTLLPSSVFWTLEGAVGGLDNK